MRYLLFCLPFLLFACQDDDDGPIPQDPMAPDPTDTIIPQTVSFLALGDSYTIGTGVEADQRWPVQLAAAISQRDSFQITPPDIVATNGWTTRNLLYAIESRRQEDLAETYDLVSLLIGVNNQFQGRSLAEYRTEFKALLDTAIVFAGGQRERVFVVSIPDYAFTPFGDGRQAISEGVNQFNVAASTIVQEYNLPFLNITPISREGLDDPELVAGDNLHPSGKQYQRWVREVLEEAVVTLLE